MSDYPQAVRYGGAGPFPWPPAPRTPFTLPDGPYHKTLPYTPPALPDRRYVRGDAWGVEIPGLPFVPQGSSEHPERCLTGFFNRWDPRFGVDPQWQPAILDAHVTCGYTHFLNWLADALCGQRPISVDDYVAMCVSINQRIPWLAHWLASKDYPQFVPRDSPWQTWRDVVGPILQKLIDAKAIHHAVLGGEFDLFNVPGQVTHDIAKWAMDVCGPAGVEVYFHFSTWKTAWFADGSNRFDWTSQMCDLGVRGLYFQGDSDADSATYQGRIADTLGRVDPRFDFVNCEDCASNQFTHDHPTEIEACSRGFAHQCTIPAPQVVPMWGYFNGGYHPSGEGL